MNTARAAAVQIFKVSVDLKLPVANELCFGLAFVPVDGAIESCVMLYSVQVIERVPAIDSSSGTGERPEKVTGQVTAILI